MPDASPRSFDAFAHRILKEEETAKNFNIWNAKGGPDGEMNSCDQSCRRYTYCSLVTSFADTEDECNQVEVGSKPNWRREKGLFPSSMEKLFDFNQDMLFDFMTNPWFEKI